MRHSDPDAPGNAGPRWLALPALVAERPSLDARRVHELPGVVLDAGGLEAGGRALGRRAGRARVLAVPGPDEPPLPWVPTHGDLSPRNWIFAARGGERRLGVIDWARAQPSIGCEDAWRMVYAIGGLTRAREHGDVPFLEKNRGIIRRIREEPEEGGAWASSG